MGKLVDLDNYKTKISDNKKNKNVIPTIIITKRAENNYDVLVDSDGEQTVFNKKPIPKLSIAVYAASYCKDRLCEYTDKFLSTDIIGFDKECTKELNLD